MVERSTVKVYGAEHAVRVIARRREGADAPRLVVVSFLPNETASRMLRLCLDSIRRYTPEPHELWVVDNASPPHLKEWLEREPDLNVVFNETPAVPRPGWLRRLARRGEAQYAGSYANAVALELAARIVDPDTRMMMTLHMDTMACRTGWLSYLRGKLDDRTRCVGVRMDTGRVRTVHVLGMLFDFTLFAPLRLTFRHDMPRYDVGDAIPMALERSGYRLWACRNTLWNPELVELLPHDSPYRSLRADRSLDDQHEVIFLHLGRGVATSCGGDTGRTAQQWLDFGQKVVLQR